MSPVILKAFLNSLCLFCLCFMACHAQAQSVIPDSAFEDSFGKKDMYIVTDTFEMNNGWLFCGSVFDGKQKSMVGYYSKAGQFEWYREFSYDQIHANFCSVYSNDKKVFVIGPSSEGTIALVFDTGVLIERRTISPFHYQDSVFNFSDNSLYLVERKNMIEAQAITETIIVVSKFDLDHSLLWQRDIVSNAQDTILVSNVIANDSIVVLSVTHCFNSNDIIHKIPGIEILDNDGNMLESHMAESVDNMVSGKLRISDGIVYQTVYLDLNVESYLWNETKLNNPSPQIIQYSIGQLN